MLQQHSMSKHSNFLYELDPPPLFCCFTLIVIRPVCDSEWSLSCHSTLAFCFYITVPSMQKYDLFSPLYRLFCMSNIKNKVNRINRGYFIFLWLLLQHFTFIYLFIYPINYPPHPPAQLISLTWIWKAFILMRFSLSPHSLAELVNLQWKWYAVLCLLLSQSAAFPRVNSQSFLISQQRLLHDFICKNSMINNATGLL